jgi:hypothetical protein
MRSASPLLCTYKFVFTMETGGNKIRKMNLEKQGNVSVTNCRKSNHVFSILHSHCLEVVRFHVLVLAWQVLGLVSDSQYVQHYLAF